MLNKLETALKASGIPFAHFAWDKAPKGDYGVWGEDSAQHFFADGRLEMQTTQGTIDLFTRNPSGNGKDAIQSILNDLGVAWHLNSVQYESDTRYVHYEWVFEVV